ncbi:NAD-dependent malic enzyme [Duodenibacillus massiliensis]|mgnify:CR=1 FL=1|jgi:NADP-dependent malic enzyme|uniref:NAD-dependent malic enzyme n=1 Tax=Duodenibacillus massiliensis TaxID=1852381 RepID=UPI000334EBB9|nr:NAD-dependent malic enzyme [Duodenibacillus massiliensis]MBE5701140.1 NAD-dependent malic enzyme [Sutterella sp.]MBS5791843.1 NAD-dependent malic enzyme [Sutterella sp.]CDD72603.1 malic enzyme NAD binding domain protein [Sutterella sp. CAG:397]HAF64873.1 NAD-dependent malic enzyme [Sutterella sp.]
MTTNQGNQPRGVAVLRNPWLNRGSVFTEEERDRLGLRGLLPPRVSTFADQVSRLKEVIDSEAAPINKYLTLESVHASDEALYFQLVMENVEEYMPLIYTPTVGEACQKFSHIFRYARGLYISSEDRGRVRELVANVPNHDVDIIVVTDGQRILGLGDLGVNGMGIPVGKLALYTACAGVNPQRALPVTLDVGTNNEEFLKDPLYMGLRQHRVTGPEYMALVEEFITAVRERWPNVLIQFEDFQNTNAFALLDAWRDRVTCFNDDIQGTAAVVVTGLYTAVRALKQKLSDQRILFLGAGAAATGIAHLIADAMAEDGIDRNEALKRIALFDSKGLVSSTRGDKLAPNKVPFAQAYENTTDFAQAIRQLKPTCIIGVSAQGGAFTEDVVKAMCEVNARPMIFALSNPTSKAECTAKQAYTWSEGKCLFACGSPFAPVAVGNKTFVPRQGNNSYVFPGIGFGCIFVRAKTIPNQIFLTAAKTLANLVSESDLANGSLYPPLSQVRELSAHIAVAVADYCFKNGLAQVERPADLDKAVREAMWQPTDPKFVFE